MKIVGGDFGKRTTDVYGDGQFSTGIFSSVRGSEIADVSIVNEQDFKTHGVKVLGLLTFGLGGMLVGSLFDGT